MKLIKKITAAVIALAMAGCNEVPEDVKSRAEQQQQQTSSRSVGDTGDTADPSKNSDADPTGITIACKPDPINTDKFYILKTPDYLEGRFDDEDAKRLCSIMNGVFGTSFTVEDVEKEYMGSATNGGIVGENYGGNIGHTGPSFLFSLKGDIPIPEQIKDLGAYDLKRYTPDNYPKEKLVMTDGKELAIEDAIKQTDGYIRSLKEYIISKDEELRLCGIYIGDTGCGAELILEYEQMHYGLPLDNGGFLAFPAEPDIDLKAESAMRSGSFTALYLNSERPLRLWNCTDNTFVEKQEIDKILTFEEASKKLTDTLAENMTFTVEEAALKYCCYYTADADVSSYTYRPMWTFVLKEQHDRKGYLQFLRPRIMGYVDAVNGDVYYSDYEMHYIEKAE